MSPKDEIVELVRRINSAWRNGRYDELQACFSEDIVLAMPGLRETMEGREAIIASYRDFRGRATIHEFQAEEPRVEVFRQTAVATMHFRIGYEYEGKASSEGGIDVLVFENGADGWRVVWRTVVMTS